MNLKNKYGNWALITGSSSGIGKEFAFRFAKEGVSLVLIARREELLVKIKTDIQHKFNVNVIIIPIDLTREDICDVISEKTDGIKISILVNNAGSGYIGEFSSSDDIEYLNLIKLNCIAPVLLTKWFLKNREVNKKSAVIFIGSVVGILPSPKMSVYSASKAFINTLGESIWNELHDSNTDVITVLPGSTDTEFTRISKGKSFNIRSTENVVDTTLKYLGNKPSIIDGIINRIAFTMFRILPRKLTLNFTRIISQKFFSTSE